MQARGARKRSKNKHKRKVYENALYEFIEKPVVTICSLISAIAAILVVIISIISLAEGSLPFEIPTSKPEAHKSTVTLLPEIINNQEQVNFTMSFCNDKSSSVSVNEIRFHTDTANAEVSCDTKEGWNLFISSYNYCTYRADEDDYILPGSCVSFNFNAKAKDVCEIPWQFASLDLNHYMVYSYITTEVENCS